MTTPDVTNPAYLEELERLADAYIASRAAFTALSDEQKLEVGRPDWWVDYRAFSDALNPQTAKALIHRARVAGEMEEGLRECREFIERYSDMRDGDYGAPEPNEAMQLVHAIDQALGGDRK